MMIQILRWIAVLPGALLGVLLAMFPWHWLVLFMQSGSGDDSFISYKGKPLLSSIPTEVLEYAGVAFLTPFVLVSVGTYIAPKFKFQTGIAMSILWGMGFVASLTYVLISSDVGGWNGIRLVSTCILGIIGVGLALRTSKLAASHRPVFPLDADFCEVPHDDLSK